MLQAALFAKPPVPGRVKTRLSPALPAPLAAALYQAFLEDAAARLCALREARPLLYLAEDGSGAPSGRGDWAGGFAEVRPQRGADLGERMAAAFDEMLRSPADRALIVGADSPDLPPDTLAAAAAVLEHSELVIGPARDGGYYLIGLARPAPELFRAIAWGSGQVLAQTRSRADALGLRLATLPVWPDVDEPADLADLVGRMLGQGAEARAPATARALRALGLLPAR